MVTNNFLINTDESRRSVCGTERLDLCCPMVFDEEAF